MDFSNALPGEISIFLVFLGIVLLLIAYYFHYQTRRLNQTIAKLYQLNNTVSQDALDFFEQAWSILEKAGVSDLKANIDWFGECRRVSKGKNSKKPLLKKHYLIERDDMQFDLNISIPRYYGERLGSLELIILTFVQILQQDVEHKQAEILQSQKRLERYQLFVQHEIKNIAQFIQLLSEQVIQLENDEDKVRLMDRLKNTMPVMAQRASHTLQKMQQPLREFYGSDQVDLASVIEEVLFMYELDAELTGQAQVIIARSVLIEVFKNILGNYRDHALTDQSIKIGIEKNKEQSAVVTIESYFAIKNAALNSERLFEPFWTTSESGMGLGLFLTRELLKQVGSEIEFSHNEDKVVFTLTLNNIPQL
ncbi:MAG TPA: hypothetical protein ENK73_01485 [Thiomicrospira sp.]|nr:hypothetical protein [Thiomicrospira sp.]